MPVFFLAALALAAPARSVSANPTTIPEWNQLVLTALQEHAQTRAVNPAAAADKLADVAHRVASDKQLTLPNRRRLLTQIQRRLAISGQHILAQQLQPVGNGDTVGATKGAEALKEMIEQTIEPDSWDVNGGKGHIHVFRE